MFIIIVLVLGIGGGACDFGITFFEFCASSYVFSFLFTLVFFQAIYSFMLLFPSSVEPSQLMLLSFNSHHPSSNSCVYIQFNHPPCDFVFLEDMNFPHPACVFGGNFTHSFRSFSVSSMFVCYGLFMNVYRVTKVHILVIKRMNS
jgi:hypothetical protein